MRPVFPKATKQCRCIHQPLYTTFSRQIYYKNHDMWIFSSSHGSKRPKLKFGMIAQFLTLKLNTSTKNSNFIEISLKFSKTSTARNRRGAPQSAHLYSHRKNKSNELRKKKLFSNIPVGWAFHVSSLPAPARTLKFPPVCKSPTSGAADTENFKFFKFWQNP